MDENILNTPQEQAEVDTVGDQNAQVESATKPTRQIAGNLKPERQIADSFTRQQVDDIVKKRVNRFYGRYGCKNRQELDNMIGKVQSYDVIKGRYGDLQVENAQLKEKLTFHENNIEPNRYDDIKAYFKGKSLELNDDTLKQAITTHPEWLRQPEMPTTTIQTLGVERTNGPTKETADERRHRVFGY